MILYLAGIFMGAIDTGIVTPARTIIQNSFGIEAQSGIWMITIYTLAYAASVPIMGKLADKFGRKYVYLTCITLFGAGSLFCGLSESFGGFPLLIAARAVQAIGGGGIVPIATAEFGTTFPPEKRGMALGLVGGVYGIANVFGASAGSAILDLFGAANWKYIFFINIPISLFIIIVGFAVLKNTRDTENRSKIDVWGILSLTIMILALLYGLKNLDFFDFGASVATTGVYPYLLVFAALIPVFIFIEKRAEDPVISLKYFTDRNILVTLVLSTVSGFVMMGVIFVPQFSENCLKLSTGSGGYLVIILGLFAGIGAPVSGKLIDRFGPKIILAFGFACSIAGALFMMFVTTASPSMLTVMVGLALSGLGMGFTMGTPVNYMMLANTDPRQSNSALATLSLVRSIGTAVAPAIMVGFIANAGMAAQSDIMALLPKQIDMPSLPYVQEVTASIDELKSNPQMADKLKDMEMPDLAAMETVNIDMNANSNFEMPPELLTLMQSSDVTNITENTKTMAKTMFAQMEPELIEKIQSGIQKGIDGVGSGITEMQSAKAKLDEGYAGIGKGIDGMNAGLAGQETALKQLKAVSGMLTAAQHTQSGPVAMGESQMPQTSGMPSGTSIADMIPQQVKANIPAAALKQLEEIRSVDELNEKISELESSVAIMKTKIQESQASQAKMKAAAAAIDSSIGEMQTLSSQMAAMSAAVPGAFDTALSSYLKEIDNRSDKIEGAFQSTLNSGFSDVYLTTVIAAGAALLLLSLYDRKKEPRLKAE